MKRSLLALIWILASAALAGCGEATSETSTTAALPIEVATVRVESGHDVVDVHTGRIVARRTSALGFERAGRLERVWVDEGDRVEAGQLLARIDTRALEAERAQASAQIAEAEAQLAMARLTTERTRKLRASDHTSKARLDEAVFAERALDARRAAARATLVATDAALALSEIRAPYPGQIVARHLDEGTVAQPGQAILHLVESGALEARIGIPPEVAPSLVPGMRLGVEAEGRSHPAVVEAVVEAVERDTRTLTVVLALAPEPTGGGPPPRDGALARLSVPRRIEGTGFWLPLAALAESHRGLWSAYALGPAAGGPPDERIVERRALEVLHVEDDRVFARGALRDGEQIAASGTHRLVPGQRVRALEPARSER